MAEIVKRTIIGAVVNVGELTAPARNQDGEDLGPMSVKVLHILDPDEGIETIVYLEPGVEPELARALTGGIVIARAGDIHGANGS